MVIRDGASWIDEFFEMYCPNGVRIVDWYHAVERLWGLGREAFGERASEWVEKVKEWLWEGRVEEVVRECESEGVARTAEYFRERREQMDYPAFRKAGYPIGSGVAEGACKGRCKGRGQRWKSEGLEAILALRSAVMRNLPSRLTSPDEIGTLSSLIRMWRTELLKYEKRGPDWE